MGGLLCGQGVEIVRDKRAAIRNSKRGLEPGTQHTKKLGDHKALNSVSSEVFSVAVSSTLPASAQKSAICGSGHSQQVQL